MYNTRYLYSINLWSYKVAKRAIFGVFSVKFGGAARILTTPVEVSSELSQHIRH